MALSRALLVLVCLVTTLAPARAAQGGYTRERFPELGVDLDRPRDYEAIPTQPDEQFVALYFAENRLTLNELSDVATTSVALVFNVVVLRLVMY